MKANENSTPSTFTTIHFFKLCCCRGWYVIQYANLSITLFQEIIEKVMGGILVEKNFLHSQGS